ncbi:MAG: hypothetical protein IPM48_03910 [Saprospiraceae bacterium]|nr:hypothetical protein [Saprospiraceae bacterium]
MNAEIVWDILDKASIIIGIITVIISIAIWFKLQRQNIKIAQLAATTPPPNDWDKYYDEYKNIRSEVPFALVISLLEIQESAKGDVQRYFKGAGLAVSKIEEIKMDGLRSKEDIKNYLTKLRECRRGPLSEATELRLFIAGPVMAGTLAGAVFDNWIPVLLYHRNRAGTYEYWGPLLKS